MELLLEHVAGRLEEMGTRAVGVKMVDEENLMTPEDMERAIEFLIQQQAQFGAGMLQLRDQHAESYRRLSDAILTLTGVVGTLSEGQGRLREAEERSEQRIAELADQGKVTDAHLAELTERLNAFITYVERYIDEARKGKNRN